MGKYLDKEEVEYITSKFNIEMEERLYLNMIFINTQ